MDGQDRHRHHDRVRVGAMRATAALPPVVPLAAALDATRVATESTGHCFTAALAAAAVATAVAAAAVAAAPVAAAAVTASVAAAGPASVAAAALAAAPRSRVARRQHE